MNRSDFIKAIAEKTELPINKTGEVIEAAIEVLTEALSKGDDLTLVGFGRFSVKQRNARTGRNPSTGAELKIPASKVASFKPGNNLKAAVNKK